MSPPLLLDDLVAARTHERREQAYAYRLRQAAHQVATPWRERAGWRLVEIGLRLATSAEPGPVRRPACH